MTNEVARGVPVPERIRARAAVFSGASERIANVVRARPAQVLGMTVTDLATESGTSLGSVVRFSQELGFRGFQELKLQLAADVSSDAPSADSTTSLPAGVLLETAEALREAAFALDATAFEHAVDLLDTADRVLVAGVGTSQPVAADAAYRLQMAGLATVHNPEVHSQHVTAALMGPRQVCLAVSHSGTTQETLTVTEAAREAGAATICLTSFARTPLAERCDVVLVAGSAETRYRLEAMTSRFVHQAVVDALYAALAQRSPERAAKAQASTLRAVSRHRL